MSLPELTKEEFAWLNRNGILDFKDFIAKLQTKKMTATDDELMKHIDFKPKSEVINKLKKDEDDCIDDK